MLFTEGMYPCHAGILTVRPNGRYVVMALGGAAYRRVAEVPWAGEWAGKARLCFAIPGVED